MTKHFEVIVHQMMQKVSIEDPGDTRSLSVKLLIAGTLC